MAAAEKAFGTELHNYTKGGTPTTPRRRRPPCRPSLHGAVLTVTGLDNAPAHRRRTPRTTDDRCRRRARCSATPGPFSTYYGSNTDKKLPSRVRHARARTRSRATPASSCAPPTVPSNYTGKGVTVAITDAYASPTIVQDAAKYAKQQRRRRPYKSAASSRQVLPSDYNSIEECGASGWYGEETLDVEAVHAVAPAADIVYVGGASCFDDDLLDALNKVVDYHLADIVSNSWGDIEANATPDMRRRLRPGLPDGARSRASASTSPAVTTATTSRSTASEAGRHPGELRLGDRGRRHLAGRRQERQVPVGDRLGHRRRRRCPPTARAGPASPARSPRAPAAAPARCSRSRSTSAASCRTRSAQANGATAPMRVVPDIAAVADPNTGFLVGQTQTFPDGSVQYSEYRIGGTSLACPVIAGVQALAQQARGGVPIGFANPAIYAPVRHLGATTTSPTTRWARARASPTCASTTPTRSTPRDGLLTSLRSLGKDSSLQRHRRLRRRHRRRHPRRRLRQVVRPASLTVPDNRGPAPERRCGPFPCCGTLRPCVPCAFSLASRADKDPRQCGNPS